MAQLFLTVTLNQDRQERFQIDTLASDGSVATPDGGVQGITVDSGAAEMVVDTDADASGLQVVYKSDLSATEFPSSSQITSFIDARQGPDVVKLEIIATVVTLAKEAQSLNARSLGNEARA